MYSSIRIITNLTGAIRLYAEAITWLDLGCGRDRQRNRDLVVR